MRKIIKRAGLAMLTLAIVIGAGLATQLVHVHGWQDVAVGTDTTYCGMAAQPHDLVLLPERQVIAMLELHDNTPAENAFLESLAGQPLSGIPAAHHWHAGHNVAGYLSDDDENFAYTDWSEALSALREDLERAWDDGTDEQYLEAHTMIHIAAAEQDFLVYTATHADSDHDIPTAWWVTRCTEADCAGEQS
jgi:hypothetical protein